MQLRRHRLPLLLASVTVASTVAALVHAGQPVTRGIVAGDGYYQSAVVCIDQNNNARCDSHEETTRTDAQGRFTLSGHGNVVAEISAGKTKLYSPSTHSVTVANDGSVAAGIGSSLA